jgi:hypothetical protein
MNTEYAWLPFGSQIEDPTGLVATPRTWRFIRRENGVDVEYVGAEAYGFTPGQVAMIESKGGQVVGDAEAWRTWLYALGGADYSQYP